MDQQYFYDVNIQLRTSYPQQVQFDVGKFIVDSDDVPIYDRIRAVTADSVDDLTEGGAAHSYALDYFSQEIAADRLILARVAGVAIPPQFICGTHVTTAADWVALGASATFDVTDSLSNTDTVTCGPFTGVTAFSQVLAILNAGLAALAAPTVVGLNTAEFIIDANGAVVLRMPSGQDDTDPTIAIDEDATPGTIAYLLGVRLATDGESIEGNAVETLTEAHNASKILAYAYDVGVEDRGGNDDEVVALAAQIQTERAQLTVMDTSADAVDPASSDDLQSRLSLLSYNRTTVLYSAHTDYPDACAVGAWLPADPGTKSFGHTPLTGCLPSGTEGADYDLSETQRLALEDKGANYVVRTGDDTFVHRGKTAAGVEKRMLLGKDWLEANIQNDVQALDMSTDLLGFDEVTLTALDGILRFWLDLAVTRRILTSFTITLPTVSDFSDAEKASGDIVLSKAFNGVGVVEAHTFTINGAISLS